jgi:uncharacterized tellurite resistance protein B-like protein
MILKIKQFFETHLKLNQTIDEATSDRRLKLACCALLVEMMHVDLKVTEAEVMALREILATEFALDHAELEDVLELAQQENHSATDYYRFTSLINEHYSQQQKIHLIEQLWQLANADNHIDKFEEHLIRKLAELLHVPHKHFIQSKHRVLGIAD